MKNTGFTLLETIVAVGLIVSGLILALALINTSLVYISNVQDRLVAANLAMEGIEVIRNIRDNNWLDDLSWNSGMAGDGDYQVAYNGASPVSYSGAPLQLNADGFYNYTTGAITPYSRKISITNISDHETRVVSKVSWQKRGKDYELSAEEHLFNWK
ncbi:MAG: type II secretion system protein [Candidatus Azambacteria bacterium]|nr:type II secretion system protein [Candidatus Azambacteria bacterium]